MGRTLGIPEVMAPAASKSLQTRRALMLVYTEESRYATYPHTDFLSAFSYDFFV